MVYLWELQCYFFPLKVPLFVTRHRMWKGSQASDLFGSGRGPCKALSAGVPLPTSRVDPTRVAYSSNLAQEFYQPTRPILWLCYSMQSDGSPLGQIRAAVAATSQTSWVCIYRRHHIRAQIQHFKPWSNMSRFVSLSDRLSFAQKRLYY